MSDRITAVVSPRSLGGISLFDADSSLKGSPFKTESVEDFKSSPDDVQNTVLELERLGFKVTSQSECTVSIEGNKSLFEKIFRQKLSLRKVSMSDSTEESLLKAGGTVPEYFDVAGQGSRGAPKPLEFPGDLRNLIEGVAFSIPPIYFAESPLPPLSPVHASAYRYLTVPDEVATLLHASKVHRRGITGRGVVVSMPDSGFYFHEFYQVHGYRARPTILAAGATDPSSDSSGHGTGEAANIFATAPDIELQPIKNGDAIDSIRKSVAAGAQVISNSWGYDVDKGATTWATLDPYLKALALEIQLAINRGITVCFAAGNGHNAFPSGMPDVIAVGGVHLDYPTFSFEASSYASSFDSVIFPGRSVPDFCGLTGRRVNINGGKAPSLMLPVQPGANLDGIDPSTGSNNDGWGLFSGTSAACPQIAGLCALLLEADPWKTPADVKQSLLSRCRDVSTGTTAHGVAAVVGPDLATGAGLATAI
ncbi:MAG: S8 family serine peptidase [Verrucomicrobiota bacterium]